MSGSAAVPAAAEFVAQSIPARFEQIVRLHSERTAIGSGDWQPTFEELNAAANRIAHHVLGLPGVHGDRIAILMRHDGPQIAAILGALKAGRIVAVMNPSDPESMLERLLADSEPRLIVTDSRHHQLAEKIAGKSIGVVVTGAADRASVENPAVSVAPTDLAFLIYTSGSTGLPKAVMQPHQNVVHNARRLAVGLELMPEDRTVLLGSTSGGQGLATLSSSLLSGGSICPFSVIERGIAGLAEFLEHCGITIWVSAASLFRHFVEVLNQATRFPRVRVVRLGSEAVTSKDFDAWKRHFDAGGFLMHTYSSSETGNITQFRLSFDSPEHDGRLPVGPPVEGMELLLLDENGQEIESAGEGEISVRSRFLSPGYWRRDALTAERFTEGEGPAGTRIFRTGDLARRNEHGELVFNGRADSRVKVRGYRVELSAIEEAISQIHGVERAMVRVRSAPSEDTRIAAYIIRRRGGQLTTESIRRALYDTLPRYMVPTVIVFLDAFPLTPHGKVDVESLDSLEPQRDDPASTALPLTRTEKAIAAAWESVFRNGAVARDANFFDLGGDSLLAAVVAARVHSESGLEIDLRFFADHPRLSEFASAVDRLQHANRGESAPALIRVSRETPLPLSFGQERIWRFSQTPDGSAGYTVACSYRLVGPLDVDRFRRSVGAVVARHESLRTTFELSNGEPVQRIHASAPTDIPLIDLSDCADARERAGELLGELASRAFDLGQLPLLRLMLVRTVEHEHLLLRASHHIISDAWSWRVFFGDLAASYREAGGGDLSSFPESERLQYADFAAWQRSRLDRDSSSYREAVQWWKSQLLVPPRPLELPTRRWQGVPMAKPEDGLIWWGLEKAISVRLESVARSRGATYFMIRLAAFAVQLAWETESEDFVLGTYATNRTRLETQGMFGFFANLTTLRMRPTRGRPFSHWLAQTQTLVSEVQARSEIPYEELREELKREGIVLPEIRAIFSLSDHRTPVQMGDVELSWVERKVETMPWGFSLAFDPNNETDRCSVMFDARQYDPVWVSAFLRRYTDLLDAISRDPEAICWPESARYV